MSKKLLAGLAAAGLLASGGGAAALTTAGVPSAAASTVAVAPCVHGHGPLASLIAKGTITRSQAMAIHDALVSNFLARGGALDTVLGQLVSKRAITKAQASAVTRAFTQWMQAHSGLGTGHDGCGGGMMGGSGSGTMQDGS